MIDYSDKSVHVWDVDPEVEINEEYVSNLGFHLSEVSWMGDDNISIHFHKRVLL